MRCILSTPVRDDEWKHTNKFHTFVKCPSFSSTLTLSYCLLMPIFLNLLNHLPYTFMTCMSILRGKLLLSNEHYKLLIDVHCRKLEFNEGDYVMFCVHLEHYSNHSFKKFHAWAIGHFLIICKIGVNAYLLNLPSNINISPNVEDLLAYRVIFVPPTLLEGFPSRSVLVFVPHSSPPLQFHDDQIDKVLDT